MSLISVFGPNKFIRKGNLLAFGEVASASAHPAQNGPIFEKNTNI